MGTDQSQRGHYHGQLQAVAKCLQGFSRIFIYYNKMTWLRLQQFLIHRLQNKEFARPNLFIAIFVKFGSRILSISHLSITFHLPSDVLLTAVPFSTGAMALVIGEFNRSVDVRDPETSRVPVLSLMSSVIVAQLSIVSSRLLVVC